MKLIRLYFYLLALSSFFYLKPAPPKPPSDPQADFGGPPVKKALSKGRKGNKKNFGGPPSGPSSSPPSMGSAGSSKMGPPTGSPSGPPPMGASGKSQMGPPSGPSGPPSGSPSGLAEMPKPPKAVIDPRIKEIVPKGLDTTDVGNQGNWLLKRVWYEQAEDTFGKLLHELDSIIQLQIKLFKLVTSSEKKAEVAFKKIGLETDVVKKQLDYIIKEAKDKSTDKEASVVREAKELVSEHLKSFEQLQGDVKKYYESEASLNDVVNQIISQVNKAREYQKDGWDDFKEIGSTLDDAKAKKLYYKLEGYQQTLTGINNYLSGALKSFIEKLSSHSSQTADKIVALLHELEKKDINLSEIEKTFKDASELLEKEEKEAKRKADAKAKKKKPVNKGWFASIIDWFTSWF